MSNQYFVYKTNHITNIGGITPPLPHTGHLGLAVQNGWFLGVIDHTELDWFQKAKEFNINPCTEEEANGFKLVGVTQIRLEDHTTRELTEEELVLQKIGEAFLAKLELRPRVAAMVGDQDDQMSDLAKRIALLERCIFMMYNAMKTASTPITIPEPWSTLLDTAYTDFTTQNLKDPVDVRPDGYINVYEILKARGNILTEQLITYYQQAMS